MLLWTKEKITIRHLSRNTKCKLYKTLTRPVLLYGSECWTLDKDNEERLKTFEEKILRKIYGPVNKGGKCCIIVVSCINCIMNQM
jgi:hypothetical protein